MRKSIFTLLFCMTALCCSAKKANAPLWVRGELPTQSNGSYYFKVTVGHSSNKSEAREYAIDMLITDLMLTQKSTIRESQSSTNIRIKDSSNGYYEETNHNISYRIERGDFDAYFRIVDEYYSDSTHWILLEVARNPDRVRFDDIRFTSNYGGRALWRSMIVPGWGQMYKKSVGKGVGILCGEVALAGGIIASENLRKGYINKRAQTLDINLVRTYTTKANNAKNIRNICIGGAAALYVYNLVDAIVAPGARRVVSVTPYTAEYPIMNGTMMNGVTVSFNF